jgi:hypothetical protein
MHAISTRYGTGFAETAPTPAATPRPRAGSATDSPRGTQRSGTAALRLGLQLSRANAMALTRLQLALCTGERRQALEAIDRLHTLDAKLERVVAQLDGAPAEDQAIDDQNWDALSTHLADQKLALAFEKLALASGIVGPGLTTASPPLPRDLGPPAGAAPRERPALHPADPPGDAAPLTDWHAFPAVQPTEWNPFANRTFTVAIGVVLALVVTAMLAVAAVTMTGF